MTVIVLLLSIILIKAGFILIGLAVKRLNALKSYSINTVKGL